MASTVGRGIAAVLLLCGANAFMTTAWYLHLKFKHWHMAKAIFLSWLIAFLEYCLQVPANRLGHFSGGGPFTAPQLKIIQEFITLTAFGIFSILVLKEKLRKLDLVAFALIMCGVVVGMLGKPNATQRESGAPVPPPVAPEAPLPETALPVPPPAQPGSGVRRRLLQLLPMGQRRTSAGGGSDDSSGDGGSKKHEHLEEHQAATEASALPTGASTPQLLPTPTDELHRDGSAAVLVATQAAVHASNMEHGVHRREATHGAEPATNPAGAAGQGAGPSVEV